MAAPASLRTPSPALSGAMLLASLTPPVWNGREPWGVVWCCSDLTPGPEALLGTEAGELLVLQGLSTLPSPSVSADIAWATGEYPISHVFVLAHAGCQLLERALRAQRGMDALRARVTRDGLGAERGVDALSRSIASQGASALRRELAQLGCLPEVVVAYVDERGRFARVSGASAGQA